MTPKAQPYLVQSTGALDEAIGATAEDADIADDYQRVIGQYRGAMKLNNVWEGPRNSARKQPSMS